MLCDNCTYVGTSKELVECSNLLSTLNTKIYASFPITFEMLKFAQFPCDEYIPKLNLNLKNRTSKSAITDRIWFKFLAGGYRIS